MLAVAGIFFGGWLISAYLSGRPILTFLISVFVLTLTVLLITYPVLAYWLLIAAVCIVAASLVLWLVWAFLPFILGFVLGVFILYMLITRLPTFIASL